VFVTVFPGSARASLKVGFVEGRNVTIEIKAYAAGDKTTTNNRRGLSGGATKRVRASPSASANDGSCSYGSCSCGCRCRSADGNRRPNPNRQCRRELFDLHVHLSQLTLYIASPPCVTEMEGAALLTLVQSVQFRSSRPSTYWIPHWFWEQQIA
jgi:hypothetical protein